MELKWPMKKVLLSSNDLSGVDFYHETTDMDQASKVIQELTSGKVCLGERKSSSIDTDKWLEDAGISQVANILTCRTRYQAQVHASGSDDFHLFHVDIDKVTYLDTLSNSCDNTYRIGEVELITAGGGLTGGEALKEIFIALGICLHTVRGKVLEYLYRFRPKHYKALETSGLIEGKLALNPPIASSASNINSWAEKLLKNSSVNIHFTRKCNYECKFCFHTAKTSHVMSLPELLAVLHQLREYGVEKINFAGGEPFLLPYRTLLGELVKGAKNMGFSSVSIISNGSQWSCFKSWFEEFGTYLDMLGISVDTVSGDINVQHGRHVAGASTEKYLKKVSDREYHLIGVRAAAAVCKEHNVKFKINTVVTRCNFDEDMSSFINEMKPDRWKVFQVLPIVGENTASEAAVPSTKQVDSLLITDEQFTSYVNLNKANLHDPTVLKAESNRAMQSSYIIIDEFGRFLDCSTGMKVPTSSILEVGLENAAKQLLNSIGGDNFEYLTTEF